MWLLSYNVFQELIMALGQGGGLESFQASPLLHQAPCFPRSCLHIREQSERFVCWTYWLLSIRWTQTNSATDRPLSGPQRTLSAWVADTCAVPSPASSAPLSTAQQAALAWAQAAVKAARLVTGMQGTAAQAGWRAAVLESYSPLVTFYTPLGLRLQRSRISTGGKLQKYSLSIVVGSSRVPNFVMLL